MNGTIISSNIDATTLVPVDNTLDPLTLNHPEEVKSVEESSTSVCESDVHIPECCSHCGK
jgi:hypothetical protein